mmetsp:Transcript_38972/g.64721  ORF Transcript_38972/g.64721 Transcript_38972/m.64721 type:complete len:290 (-) Transcript_38972:79-948(-)
MLRRTLTVLTCTASASIRRTHGTAFSGMASSQSSHDQSKLDEALVAVDIAAAPQVHVTYPVGENFDPGELDSLAVLDSSFNPPTSAHMHMLDMAATRFGARWKLLLLAKQNADKPVVGATLPQRLQMMELLARADSQGHTLCGVTAHPLFVDKAIALQALCGVGSRILLLVGFDTWIRVTDPKYYAEGQLQTVLAQLFDLVEIVVASRDSASAAAIGKLSMTEQEAEVRRLTDIVTRGRLHFLRNDEAMATLSSSAVRNALAAHDEGAAHAMVPACLHEFVAQHGLYQE